MNLKEWQGVIETKVGCNEISKPRLFTVMRDKTNELQEKIEGLEMEASKQRNHSVAAREEFYRLVRCCNDPSISIPSNIDTFDKFDNWLIALGESK